MRILVIEDNKEIAESLKNSLEEKCYAVDICEDGENGSFSARTNDYDLIILDFMLPKKNGLGVCQEIREAGKNTPILILSVESETKNKVDFLNLGADDYMTKPFSLSELLARINAILRRPELIKPETTTIGNITIDPKKQIVLKGKIELNLTRKEFMLLKYLAHNKGNVLSRGMIMEHVWDTNLDPFSNTIESHIVSLRKKLGNKNKIIKTVSGRGYKI